MLRTRVLRLTPSTFAEKGGLQKRAKAGQARLPFLLNAPVETIVENGTQRVRVSVFAIVKLQLVSVQIDLLRPAKNERNISTESPVELATTQSK